MASETFEELKLKKRGIENFNSFTIPNYEIFESWFNIEISLKIDGIENQPKDLIQVDIETWFLEVKIKNLKNIYYYFRRGRFSNEINVLKSCYKISKGILKLILVKLNPGLWITFCYVDPEVTANFIEKMKQYMSNPILKSRAHILLNLRQNSDLYAQNDTNIRSLIYQFLEDADLLRGATIEEIVDYFMSTWTDSSSDGRFEIFSYAVFLQEKSKVAKFRGEKLGQEWVRENKNSSTSFPENKKAEEFKNKGNLLFKDKKFLDATEAYSQAIRLDPNRASYYFNRSVAWYSVLNYHSCLSDLKEALAIDPFSYKSHWYLSKCLRIMFELNEAKTCLIKAKILEPGNIVLDKELDETCYMSDDFTKYINSIKLGDNLDNDKLIATLVGRLINSISYLMDVNIFKKKFFYEIVSDQFNSYIIRAMINLLGKEGLSCKARVEVKRLISKCGYYSSCLFHLFLAKCSYYEDNENETLENIKIFKGKSSNQLFELELKYCNDVDQIYSLRRMGNNLFEKGLYNEAVNCFMQCLENHAIIPVVESNLFYKIACAMSKLNKDYDELVYLNIAIIKKGDNHEAIAARGEHYLRQKDFINALHDFKTANKLHPCESYKDLINRAKLKQSSFPNDEKLLKEISLQKSLAVCKKEKGNKYFKDKRYEEAINAFSEAMNLDSCNPVYYSNRAACYIELKDFKKGLHDCERALELDPFYVKGLYRLSVCHIALGRPEEAAKALDKALKRKPKDESLRAEKKRAECLREYIINGNTAFNDKNYTDADHNYSKALLTSEACVKLRLKRVDCLIHLEKFDDALSEADLVCSLDCENPELFFFRGLCYFYKQEKNKSIECLEKSLSLKSEERVLKVFKMVKNIFCLKDLGDQAYRENEYKEALAHYQDALKQDSKNKKFISHFHFHIGIIHVKEHNIKEAINNFTAVINLQHDTVKAYKQRAECYLKLGLLENALRDFEEVNTKAPNEEHQTLICETKVKLEASLGIFTEKELEISLSKIKSKKADEYFNRKNYKDALECYTKALDLDSENHLLYLSRSSCYLTLKNYSGALNDAVEALQRDDKCLEGYIISGECNTFLGNAEEAISAFEQAKKHDASNKKVTEGIQKSMKLKNCLDNAKNALKNKRFDMAYNNFKCASRIAVVSSSILLNVAECLISLQRLPGLGRLIESVNDTLKESAEYFCIKGLDFYHQDQMSETLEHLKKAIEKDPSNTKCTEYLSKIQSVYDKKQKGNDAFFRVKYDEALKLYKEGLKIETGNLIIQSKFHYNIGVVLKKRNVMPEAIESFTKAISLRENYTSALEKRAQCYTKISELENAIKDYDSLYKHTNNKKYLNLSEDLKNQNKQNSLKKDYYKILKVSRQASMDEIRNAYKALAKEFHPDRLGAADKEKGEEKFKEINEAYSVLIDPLKKERYDRGETNFHRSEPFNFGFDPFMFNPFARVFFRSPYMEPEFNPFDF